ncbi:hypothetical protein [Streptacidiphilus neutrinimicus]|uniref:hypothetical protein n=1 Tax=Streptacidiphilus neutrinimicus TaxID=105420 RepID=UPI00126A01C5|nr:hypothetical protein [Streptacidiphilus neutrinimicus]
MSFSRPGAHLVLQGGTGGVLAGDITTSWCCPCAAGPTVPTDASVPQVPIAQQRRAQFERALHDPTKAIGRALSLSLGAFEGLSEVLGLRAAGAGHGKPGEFRFRQPLDGF